QLPLVRFLSPHAPGPASDLIKSEFARQKSIIYFIIVFHFLVVCGDMEWTSSISGSSLPTYNSRFDDDLPGSSSISSSSTPASPPSSPASFFFLRPLSPPTPTSLTTSLRSLSSSVPTSAPASASLSRASDGRIAGSRIHSLARNGHVSP